MIGFHNYNPYNTDSFEIPREEYERFKKISQPKPIYDTRFALWIIKKKFPKAEAIEWFDLLPDMKKNKRDRSSLLIIWDKEGNTYGRRYMNSQWLVINKPAKNIYELNTEEFFAGFDKYVGRNAIPFTVTLTEYANLKRTVPQRTIANMEESLAYFRKNEGGAIVSMEWFHLPAAMKKNKYDYASLLVFHTSERVMVKIFTNGKEFSLKESHEKK